MCPPRSWTASRRSTSGPAAGVPAFKGYRGYPATLCTSVNDVIVHGIPSAEHKLRDGDVLGLDCGVVLDGFVGDAAITVPIGEISPAAKRLLEVTRECLELAVEVARPAEPPHGHRGRHPEARRGRGVLGRAGTGGHGIGRSMHEDPQVYNFGPGGRGPELRPGLVLAIEPMVNAGVSGVIFDDDGWTARTEDGKLSAHFEYSVAVTKNGPWVLGVGGA